MALLRSDRETLMTADELSRLPDLGPSELVEGRVVLMSPTGFSHGDVELGHGSELRLRARKSGRGKVVGGEVGIFIRRDPDTVRAADLLYISHERLATRGPSAYLDVAPELAVEILSPDDRWSDVMEKVSDYFSAGVIRVWILDSRLRKVFAYQSLNEVHTFEEGDVLSDEELLPGFSCRIADLFGE
jgi:Uma2 family endonuclease